jgi:hypothetical protein
MQVFTALSEITFAEDSLEKTWSTFDVQRSTHGGAIGLRRGIQCTVDGIITAIGKAVAAGSGLQACLARHRKGHHGPRRQLVEIC